MSLNAPSASAAARQSVWDMTTMTSASECPSTVEAADEGELKEDGAAAAAPPIAECSFTDEELACIQRALARPKIKPDNNYICHVCYKAGDHKIYDCPLV